MDLKILIPEKTDNVIIHGYRQLTRGKIKQFISELRKRDMEAMLKITDDYYDGEGIEDWNKRLQLIKDYYEK